MQFHPLFIPYIVSIAITLLLGSYALGKKEVKIAQNFAALMFALAAWIACYVLALSSTSIENKLFWTQIKYLGATIGPAIWFFLAFEMTRREAWLSRWLRVTVWSWVILTNIVILSNDYHHWFWTGLKIVPGYLEAQSGHGPYFWVYAITCYSFMLVGCSLYIDFYRRTPKHYQRRGLLLAAAGVLPVLAHALKEGLGVRLVPQLDQVPLMFLGSSLLFAYAIFRYNVLQILPIAHDLIIKNIKAGIVVVDADLQVVHINPYAQELATVDNALGQHILKVYPGMDDLALDDGAIHEIEIIQTHHSRWISLQVSMISDDEVVGYVLVGLDITERKAVEFALEVHANTDPLTGALNRRAFLTQAENELARAKRHDLPMGLIMADIDNLKQINDSFGYQTGDDVLVEVVKRSQNCLRKIDLFARYGGEQFIILIAADEDVLINTAQKLSKVIEYLPVDAQQQKLKVTLSLGIAVLDNPKQTVDELVIIASQALHQSKQSGGKPISLNFDTSQSANP